jgi:branched-chain amino acid transport system permease protein
MTLSLSPKLLGLAALAAVLIVLPHLLSFSQQEVAVFLVLNVVMVVSYRLVTLTGEWSLIHVVLQGVGAYATALLAKHLGVPVPLSILLAACVAAFIAYVLSFPLFRLKAFSFLIGSFAAGEAIRLSWKYFDSVFGGSQGISLIPSIPDLGPISFFSAVNFYYLVVIVATISLLILYRLEHSRIGLIFHAIHWHDNLAASTGINVRYYRTLAFVVASFFAGLTGAMMAHYMGTVVPSEFSVDHMLFVVIWVIVGGINTFYGPIIGVVLLTVVNEVVLRSIGLDAARPLFYGVILILTMLFLPGGLDSLVERGRHALRKRLGWRGTTVRIGSAGTARSGKAAE